MHLSSLPPTTLRSLDGLSTGDAFGQLFFSPHHVVTQEAIATNAAPAGPWMTTDDTEMAVVLCEVLGRHGRVDQDELPAQSLFGPVKPSDIVTLSEAKSLWRSKG